MSQNNTRSIQQQRAHYALKKVLEAKGVGESVAKRFKSYSNTLPAMIQMNGIGQALAFAYQKSNGKAEEARGWKLLFDLVDYWLLSERNIWGKSSSAHVVMALSEGNQAQYQLAQAEAQALLSWVKDFARAEISGEAED